MRVVAAEGEVVADQTQRGGTWPGDDVGRPRRLLACGIALKIVGNEHQRGATIQLAEICTRAEAKLAGTIVRKALHDEGADVKAKAAIQATLAGDGFYRAARQYVAIDKSIPDGIACHQGSRNRPGAVAVIAHCQYSHIIEAGSARAGIDHLNAIIRNDLGGHVHGEGHIYNGAVGTQAIAYRRDVYGSGASEDIGADIEAKAAIQSAFGGHSFYCATSQYIAIYKSITDSIQRSELDGRRPYSIAVIIRKNRHTDVVQAAGTRAGIDHLYAIAGNRFRLHIDIKSDVNYWQVVESNTEVEAGGRAGIIPD